MSKLNVDLIISVKGRGRISTQLASEISTIVEEALKQRSITVNQSMIECRLNMQNQLVDKTKFISITPVITADQTDAPPKVNIRLAYNNQNFSECEDFEFPAHNSKIDKFTFVDVKHILHAFNNRPGPEATILTSTNYADIMEAMLMHKYSLHTVGDLKDVEFPTKGRVLFYLSPFDLGNWLMMDVILLDDNFRPEHVQPFVKTMLDACVSDSNRVGIICFDIDKRTVQTHRIGIRNFYSREG